MPEKADVIRDYNTVLERIKRIHIKKFPGHPEPLFLISDAYPGVWLEHAFDAVAWAGLSPQTAYVSRAQVNLFLDNQKPDGQLPCYVLDESNPNISSYGRHIGFGQIQECVSFTALCLEAARQNNDRELLERAYDKCVLWDGWLCRNRMTLKSGLIELFCGHDTGHDNSDRLSDIPGGCPDGDAKICNDRDFLPLTAPDMNAVFYGSRRALSEMAQALGRSREAAEWAEKAENVKKALFEKCRDDGDGFFYDRDRHGSLRRFRTVHITNLFCEHVLDQDTADWIFERYLHDPGEFFTPYPFPSMSASDNNFRRERDGNDWSYYSQGLTALRALRWMDHYGYGETLEQIMRLWISALVNSEGIRFSQELDPFTGRLSKSSEWYSATMLFFLYAVRRLYL